MGREHGSSFRLGYVEAPRESETMDKFMNENRFGQVVEAIRGQTEPESLKLGKELRSCSWSLGSKCVAPPPGQTSESRTRYGPKPPIEKTTGFAHLGVELRKANIDHAFGQPKSAAHWSSMQAEEMSRHAGDKFGCAKPEGLGHLGKELRKSSLVLHEIPATFRNHVVPNSEQKSRYTDKGNCCTASFSDTLGKDFRSSHIDIAQGAEKHTRDWIQVQRMATQDHAEEKWGCRKPEGFYELIEELRKSNVPLSGAGQDFMVRRAVGPQRDQRARKGLAVSYSSPGLHH
jgi:hypothetical protein